MKVTFFATCLGDRFFADAAVDAVRLLRHLGMDVMVAPDATCCGQPAFNAGHRDEAARVFRHTLDALADAEHVVLPSGSCAAMLRHHGPQLLDGAERERARALAGRTWELAQFIVHVLGAPHLGDGLRGRRIAYHHGCHALRNLHVHEEPIRLLEAAGATVVPWEADRECCGFGGLFSVKLPHVSTAMADRKLDTLPRVDVVTSADGGCLLQLGGRAAHRNGDGAKAAVGPAAAGPEAAAGLATAPGLETAPGREAATGPDAAFPPFRHLASVLWEATR